MRIIWYKFLIFNLIWFLKIIKFQKWLCLETSWLLNQKWFWSFWNQIKTLISLKRRNEKILENHGPPCGIPGLPAKGPYKADATKIRLNSSVFSSVNLISQNWRGEKEKKTLQLEMRQVLGNRGHPFTFDGHRGRNAWLA